MQLNFSSRVTWLVALGLGLGAVRCAGNDMEQNRGLGATGGSQTGGARDQFDLDLGGGGTGGGTGAGLHALCQPDNPDGCLPDDSDSCEPFGSAGSVGQGGMGGGIGAGEAGSAGSGPINGAPSSGGYPATDDIRACHLIEEGGDVVRSCQPAGAGAPDAPCLSPANCAPGTTCVGDGASGLCRPYCCLGDYTSCGAGSYCAARQVVGSSDGLEAPVCVRADQCKLSEEYPCLAGANCQCGAGTACVPVRADGTTSCVVPGTGQKGDACDGPFACSLGHVCSSSRGCLELCSTVSTQSQCATGEFCQALSSFPDDVGVCIALTEAR